MTAHSAARLTHYLVAQREENFFLLFWRSFGKVDETSRPPIQRKPTPNSSARFALWQLAFLPLWLSNIYGCSHVWFGLTPVSVLQRSPTHWAVLESISSGCVKAIRTTKVGWRDMRRQREKRFINKKRPLCCCRGGTASSRVRNWVVVLKGRTPLRLKPHCFSSTRWYFLSVGPLRASGWSTGGGNASA